MEMQRTVERAANFLEQLKHLFLWTQPKKTGIVYTGLLVGVVIAYYVPSRYLFLAWAANKFKSGHKRTVRAKQKRKRMARHLVEQEEGDEVFLDRDVARASNLISSLPLDRHLDDRYKDKQRMLKRYRTDYASSHRAEFLLDAKWSGEVFKKENDALCVCPSLPSVPT